VTTANVRLLRIIPNAVPCAMRTCQCPHVYDAANSSTRR
jgi:hypothetical protein